MIFGDDDTMIFGDDDTMIFGRPEHDSDPMTIWDAI